MTSDSRNYVESVIDQLDEVLGRGRLPRDLLRLYAQLSLTVGVSVTLENVHDAWSVWKNEIDPDHRSLVPFSELSHEVQEMDRPYAGAIIEVTLRREESR